MFLLFSLIGNIGTVDCWFYVRRSVPEDQKKKNRLSCRLAQYCLSACNCFVRPVCWAVSRQKKKKKKNIFFKCCRAGLCCPDLFKHFMPRQIRCTFHFPVVRHNSAHHVFTFCSSAALTPPNLRLMAVTHVFGSALLWIFCLHPFEPDFAWCGHKCYREAPRCAEWLMVMWGSTGAEITVPVDI